MTQGNFALQAVENCIPGLICNSTLTTSDSTNYQHHLVKMAADLTVALAGASDIVTGVLLNKPTTGHSATVAGPGSVVKVMAGGTITAGMKLGPDASGHAVQATSGVHAALLALEGASSGNLVTAQVLGGADKIA